MFSRDSGFLEYRWKRRDPWFGILPVATTVQRLARELVAQLVQGRHLHVSPDHDQYEEDGEALILAPE